MAKATIVRVESPIKEFTIDSLDSKLVLKSNYGNHGSITPALIKAREIHQGGRDFDVFYIGIKDSSNSRDVCVGFSVENAKDMIKALQEMVDFVEQ